MTGAGVGEAVNVEEATLGDAHGEGGTPAGETTCSTGGDAGVTVGNGLDGDGPCGVELREGAGLGDDATCAAGPGEAGSSVAAPVTMTGVAGSSYPRAWDMHDRSTSDISSVAAICRVGATVGAGGTITLSRSLSQAPHLVPAPSLGNNIGEYAASTN